MQGKNHIIGFFMGCLAVFALWFALQLQEYSFAVAILLSIISGGLGHLLGCILFQVAPRTTLIALFLSFIFYTTYFIPEINKHRKELNPNKEEFLKTAPPELVMTTTALGGLRGFIIDMLWLRATKLRDEGKHYEIIQLYDLIGKLEPRLPSIWEFTAWEMSYNIAASTPKREEKWRWIWKGVEQLRNYGIRYNPGAYKLYWQLAFIFFHKAGVNNQEKHGSYFQQQIIKMSNDILGSRPNLKFLVDVPRSYLQLLKHPNIQFLIQTKGVDYVRDMDDKISQKTTLLSVGELLKSELQNQPPPASDEEKQKLLKGYSLLQKHWVVKNLWEKLRMTPQKMYAIEKKYIAIDWRLAAAHSLYWAQEGVDIQNQKPESWLENEQNRVNVQNMNRLRFNALREIFEYGFPVDFEDNQLICIPNFNVIKPLNKVFMELQDVWGERGIVSHEEFLRDVVKTTYVYGRKDLAMKYYKKMKKLFKNPKYNQDLEQYVILEIARKIDYWGRAHEIEAYIIGFLKRGYLDLFRNYVDEEGKKRAIEFHQFAKLVHVQYVKRHGELKHMAKPYVYFVKTAQKSIKKTLISQNGKKRGQQIWSNIRAAYPELIAID
ncbi:hypothetical protein [Candidatus Uabimicrobium amorphum]|uniref:Uncharacterized protein n=1 Tax=Uabimicrobium amorphum TaxID=2596890 RepID=A0A5S9F2C3_UABAM|nr:hypothetical protein [Candidatus Uabimicrobium amorphum]BBM83101.1 hypothetical protein UABAM_01452 [Candidatus Uabimicrobium amorphum]